MLSAVMPILTGCQGASGFGAIGLGSLFAGFGGIGGNGGSSALISSGGDLATISNPEPASMLLMGSGMAAMAFFKSRKNKRQQA